MYDSAQGSSEQRTYRSALHIAATIAILVIGVGVIVSILVWGRPIGEFAILLAAGVVVVFIGLLFARARVEVQPERSVRSVGVIRTKSADSDEIVSIVHSQGADYPRLRLRNGKSITLTALMVSWWPSGRRAIRDFAADLGVPIEERSLKSGMGPQ